MVLLVEPLCGGLVLVVALLNKKEMMYAGDFGVAAAKVDVEQQQRNDFEMLGPRTKENIAMSTTSQQ